MIRSIFLLPLLLFTFIDTGAQKNAYVSAAPLDIVDLFQSSAKWYSEGRLNKIVFYRDSTTIHVYMNRKGIVKKVIRYYTFPGDLPIFLLAKLTERFPGYTPFAIIEEQDDADINYQINIGNGTKWMQVHSDGYGRFTVIGKYTFPRALHSDSQISTLP